MEQLTCRDVIHAIALLVHRNVAALAEDNEVGCCRQAPATDCTQGLLIFCTHRQDVLHVPWLALHTCKSAVNKMYPITYWGKWLFRLWLVLGRVTLLCMHVQCEWMPLLVETVQGGPAGFADAMACSPAKP